MTDGMKEQVNPDGESAKPWRTAVAEVTDDSIIVRGYDLAKLIGKISFAEFVLLLYRGDLPTPKEAAVVDAMFVAVAEHGISPSSTVSRYLASCGIPIQAAVAGGVLSFGDVHGGAGEEFARILHHAVLESTEQDSYSEIAARIVADYRSRGKRLPGFGHPQHRGGDPRVPRLLEVARDAGVIGPHTRLSLEIEKCLQQTVGPIRMNIDGVLAPLVLDLGIDWRLARAFIFAPRAVGLAGHVVEEWTREPGWRHVPLSEVTYDGPRPKAVPEKATIQQ